MGSSILPHVNSHAIFDENSSLNDSFPHNQFYHNAHQSQPFGQLYGNATSFDGPEYTYHNQLPPHNSIGSFHGNLGYKADQDYGVSLAPATFPNMSAPANHQPSGSNFAQIPDAAGSTFAFGTPSFRNVANSNEAAVQSSNFAFMDHIDWNFYDSEIHPKQGYDHESPHDYAGTTS